MEDSFLCQRVLWVLKKRSEIGVNIVSELLYMRTKGVQKEVVYLRPEYGLQNMILPYVIVGILRSRSKSMCITSKGAGEVLCSIFET